METSFGEVNKRYQGHGKFDNKFESLNSQLKTGLRPFNVSTETLKMSWQKWLLSGSKVRQFYPSFPAKPYGERKRSSSDLSTSRINPEKAVTFLVNSLLNLLSRWLKSTIGVMETWWPADDFLGCNKK